MKILNNSFFNGITEEEFIKMQKSNCMREQSYNRGEIIFHAGEKVSEIGIILLGSVHIENVDLWGNKSILNNIEEGEIFAESYSISKNSLLVDVTAATHTTILFVNLEKIKNHEETSKIWNLKLSHNLLIIAAKKNLALSNRNFCTTCKTIRGRLFIYLSSQALLNHDTHFKIPFNRQQMADYLNLDRSALSKELCHMRDEGILTFHKNEFNLPNMEHFH